MASEDWIVQMDVDSLPRGRHQPFYHIYTLTGPPERCRFIAAPSEPSFSTIASPDVAEENIKPLPLTLLMARDFVDTIPQISRYFDDAGVKENGWGRMCLSPESKLEYPDDDDFANDWDLTSTSK